MKLKELLDQWREGGSVPLTDDSYSIRLPVKDVVSLRAFAEMYPNRTETQMITDLLHAALEGMEEMLPYIKGNEIVGEDEFGDPLYNDAGPTPLFYELKKKHSQALAKMADVD